MLGIIYQFIKAPKQTIALYSHTKQWNVWWIIIGVSGLISTIKLSSLGLWSLAIHSIWIASSILLISLSVDVVAQLLGHHGQLKTVIYWLGFIESIYWFKPAIMNVQELLPIGGTLLFMVQLIAVVYFFIIIRTVYGFGWLKFTLVMVAPMIFIVVLLISGGVAILQQLLTFS